MSINPMPPKPRKRPSEYANPARLTKAKKRRIQAKYTGDELRQRRLDRNLTVEELAKSARCSLATVYHIENGEHLFDMMDYIEVCRVLGLPQPPLT